MKVLLTFVMAALLGSPASLHSQSTVSQAERPTNEYESPMEVKIPLAGFEKLEANQTRIDKSMAGSFCEDVEIQFVTLKRGKTKKSHVPVQALVSLFVRRSSDKRVTVRLDWMSGDEVVASGERRSFDAEEGKKTAAKIRLDLPEAALSGPAEKFLRLTLDVRTPD